MVTNIIIVIANTILRRGFIILFIITSCVIKWAMFCFYEYQVNQFGKQLPCT